MFVNCLVKQIAICLAVVAVLLLNIMEVFSVGEILCWIDRVWSSNKCAYCACDPSVPSIGFAYGFVSR